MLYLLKGQRALAIRHRAREIRLIERLRALFRESVESGKQSRREALATLAKSGDDWTTLRARRAILSELKAPGSVDQAEKLILDSWNLVSLNTSDANSSRDHIALIRHGNELHEARCYAAALPWLERAHRVAPRCPVAIYDRANTLHMLDRDKEAEPLLRGLLRATVEELRQGCPDSCPDSSPRSLQLDVHFLLFLVLLDSGGPRDEAFVLAAKHLRLRRRGLHSLWSARKVRAEISELRRKWKKGSADQLTRSLDAPKKD
ncbi:MAG: hypothetical protein HY290_28585 [Planctomycetia bacterium]|nr:hypothetical protein [Planctomycetia bacterium]